MKKFLTTLTILVASIGSHASAAGSASLSMSPASASYTVGSNFSITISENSGADTVNVVEADFTYDASKIQFVSIACNGSFEIAAATSANGLTCGTVTAKSGAQTVGVATFKALVGSGSAPITFTSSSHIYRSTDNADVWNGATTGATIGFTTPAPAQTPAPSAPTTTVPTTPTTATTNQSSNNSSPSTTDVATTPVEAPATTTKLFSASVIVVDNKGKNVKNAEITLNGKTLKTDASGKVNFTNIKAGSYDVKVKSGNTNVTNKITVNSKNKVAQSFMIKLPKTKSRAFGFLFGSIAGGIVLGGGLYFAAKKYMSVLNAKNAKPAVIAKKSKTASTSKAKTTPKTKSVAKKKTVKKSNKNLTQLVTAE